MEPGADFLLQRLQRAQAVPLEERGADMAAFIESAALLHLTDALIAMRLLSNPVTRAAIICQLLELGREDEPGDEEQRLALPTLTQLLHNAANNVNDMASTFLVIAHKLPPMAELSSSQNAELREAAVLAAQNLLRWEPQNPESHGLAARMRSLTHPNESLHAIAEVHLGIATLAQEQRCCTWQVDDAVNAVNHAAGPGVSATTKAAAAAAFEDAQAEARGCKGLLPKLWTESLMELCSASAPVAAAMLDQLQAVRAGGTLHSASHAVLDALVATQRIQSQQLAPGLAAALHECANCGRIAVRLRRCAGCKGPQYCR
ncbi:hypothetical protein ABPG75_000887 [Micractinium tetrahymenae]